MIPVPSDMDSSWRKGHSRTVGGRQNQKNSTLSDLLSLIWCHFSIMVGMRYSLNGHSRHPFLGFSVGKISKASLFLEDEHILPVYLLNVSVPLCV